MSCGKEHGEAKVVRGKYKLSGKFHHPEPNQPIRDEHGTLMGVTNPRNITHIHMYGGESIFFESLSKGKLMASRCDNPGCENPGSVYMPYRIHCPDCLGRNTPIDITDLAKRSATIHTFMITERTGAFNTLPTPIRFINIEFEGVVTILMGNLAVGEPKIGMRVVPIFNTRDPSYTIMDMYWVPEGTPESKLPEGYTSS